jgi:fructan beta-fructosidase
LATNTVLWLDHGSDNYAGITWSDIPESDGRRLIIGWMSNWKYARITPSFEWRGAMTISRELTLRTETEGVRLIQHRQKSCNRFVNRLFIGMIWSLSPIKKPLYLLDGAALEIEAEFELDSADEFGLAESFGERRNHRWIRFTDELVIYRPDSFGGF